MKTRLLAEDIAQRPSPPTRSQRPHQTEHGNAFVQRWERLFKSSVMHAIIKTDVSFATIRQRTHALPSESCSGASGVRGQ